MLKKNYLEISYLFLFVTLSVLIKWLVLSIFYENHIYTNILHSIQDKQYFPLIISISNLDFSPTYLEVINNDKLISFPLYGIIFHSLFFKLFGVHSFIILEYLFQLIFFYVFFITFNNIFLDKKKTLIFCLSILILLLILEILSFNFSFRFIELIKTNLIENFGTRVPRPLVTGIFYFLFYFLIFKIIDNLRFNFNFKYFLLIVFLLSIFLNSFFYYFINFSFLFIFLLFSYNKKRLLNLIFVNLKYIILLVSIATILIFPFVIQIINSEPDYSSRIGLIDLNFEKKLFLIKYYLLSLLRIEFLFLFILCVVNFVYLSYDKRSDTNLIEKINIFFYFIIISIISPIVFFIFSPLIISIYHFLSILIFSCLFYLLVTYFYIVFVKINIFEHHRNYNYSLIILLIIFFIGNFSFYTSYFKKISPSFSELNNLQKLINDENLYDTNFKLFTNDLNIMNLWLFNQNSQLVISDGFTNSLTNSQIEYNLINSFKNFQISENDFKKIISFNQSELRNPLIMKLFIYRYQANSLYTFSDINNYSNNFKKLIKKTSPFRAQFQIMPEDEKKRLLKMFINHNLDESITSDYVFINKLLLGYNFKIKNLNYKKIYDTKNFDIYKKNLNEN